jgi:anti-sigma regulatory factor (Ser/Thr protein kinase)
MATQILLPIEDSSQVGNARRTANDLAAVLGFNSEEAGKVSLAVTEAATNILKHAKCGRILLRALEERRGSGLEILALDRGVGMDNVTASLRDGHSTAGSPGTGLGAMARLADSFQIYSHPNRGTALRIEIWPRDRVAPAAPQNIEVGAVCLPKTGEAVCGDDWALADANRYCSVMIADGLGHGTEAARAARAATKVLLSQPLAEPRGILEECHRMLTPTRGAAVAVARVEADAGLGQFAGIGNINARVEGASARSLVSHNGTVGHNVRRIQEFSFPWPDSSLLILHSDGLATHWHLKDYPGLATKHAGLIAGVLYRDFERGRDDVTVVVIRNGH